MTIETADEVSLTCYSLMVLQLLTNQTTNILMTGQIDESLPTEDEVITLLSSFNWFID